VEKHETNSDEHKQAREDRNHLSETYLISITREDDEEDEEIGDNSDEVISGLVALVSLNSLAHKLVSLYTQVQVQNSE